MPHRCVNCGSIYPDASKELLEGCGKCGSHFFFFIRQERIDSLKEEQKIILELTTEEKKEIERDIREIMETEDEESPVVLDLESVRVLGPGKFQIDIVNLFNKKTPVVYKLEEGKYIIDLASGFKFDKQAK